MSILSEAANADHDTYRKQTAMQVMLAIHRRALDSRAVTDEDFQAVCKSVGRANGHEFAEKVSFYGDFVRQYSGGTTPILLRELEAWIKTLTAKRDPPPEFFKDLAKVDLVQAPTYIIALLKATACAPENFVKNGQPKIVSFYAKKARGSMARFIIENRLSDPEAIKDFDTGGYAFDPDLTDGDNWVFLRDQAEV